MSVSLSEINYYYARVCPRVGSTRGSGEVGLKILEIHLLSGGKVLASS